MEFEQVLESRRSIRRYKEGESVQKEHLEQMVRAAMLAPSACNTRPWEFYVVQDPGTRLKLMYAHPYAKMLKTASAAIVVCARPDLQEGVCGQFWPLDCGAAIENLLLQAQALGYGACWCGCWPSTGRMEDVRKVLGIKKSIPVGLIAVGVPDEAPKARGFYDPERVTWL